ncbi:YobI family P-loop NTPase [Raoultella planticola]|uniref:YobI-like P-loop NTPase domain-containing protein n=3 Tax=Raoultella planticola TaxID=575 RepID=A0ABU5MAT1_RAOPL|nr:hypothetical protein [Raoultella planticola]MDW4556351.1 hypothetical protein [Raoultella planticola]MDZ7447850.1 hypothetical protein [Raoultella planticola]MDZ7469307.1 hypothetical protein [Raoultella planticola]MDZ7509898.1 hypothetical protein [Raoultella planticola]MEA5397587.1 hypothetical protein [Raoultella planticola]
MGLSALWNKVADKAITVQAAWQARTAKSEPQAQQDFETLTPNIDADNPAYTAYFDALDFALTRFDVKNIAVTGAYGAGKSSVILSYLRKISERKRLRHKIKYFLKLTAIKPADEHVIISLANFETDEALKNSESLSKEQSIEYSILQQILYKVDKGSLPDSRVERIHTRNWRQILKTSISVFTMSVLAFLNSALLFPDTIFKILSLPISLKEPITAFPVLRWCGIVFLSFVICWYLLSRFYRIGFFDRKISLDKVNLLNAELTAGQQNTTSLLNLYIDEIVYFFLKTKFRVVIFEDLDRLNNGHIFIKLREVNQIINNSKLLEDRPIRFIFAVREDLLKDAESQTKFFDFIIPIIPVVDSENARDILMKKITTFEDGDKDVFFSNISLYLTDMRIMNNVINEYKLFKGLISGELSDKKLFSLIVYKNLCTKDFTRLDKQEGILYETIRAYSRKTLHSLYFTKHEEDLTQLQGKIRLAQSEIKKTDKELRAELLHRFVPEILSENYIFYSKKDWRLTNEWRIGELIDTQDTFFKFLSKDVESGIRIKLNTQYFGNELPISVIERTQLLNEYEKRFPVILDKKEEAIKKLQQDVQRHQNTINQKRHIALDKLLENITYTKFSRWLLENNLHKEEGKTESTEKNTTRVSESNMEILFFMLSNGYIEQDYMQYRSIFHPGSISESDNLFIQKLAAKVDYNQLKTIHLDNIPNIVTKIISLSFQYREGAFHPDIIAYLIDNHSDTVLPEIIKHLLNNSPSSLLYEVISTFYNEYDKDSYADLINIIFNEILALHKLRSAIHNRSDSENNPLNEELLFSFIRFISIDKLKRQTLLKQYTDEMQKDSSQIKYITENEVVPFSNKIFALGIIYESLHDPLDNKELSILKFVAKQHMYVLSIENLTVLYNIFMNEKIKPEELESRPYSMIINSGVDCLINIVHENIDDFITTFFIPSQESVDVIVSVINLDIDNELRKEIIEEMAFTIPVLSSVQKVELQLTDNETVYTIYDWLFKYNRIAADWSNIFDYLGNTPDKDIIWTFIALHSNEILDNEISLPKEVVNEATECFYNAFDKPDDLYRKITATLPISIASIDKNLPFQKFLILCKNKRVILSVSLFEQIINIYIDEGRSELNACLALIIRYNIEIFIRDINSYLLDGEELDYELIEIILNDSDVSVSTKVAIINTVWSTISDSFWNNIAISNEILFSLIPQLTKDSIRLSFFVHALENSPLSSGKIESYLNSFKNIDYHLITNRSKRAKIPATAENIRLLKQLESCGFISSFKNNSDHLEVYHRRLSGILFRENEFLD